MRFDGFVALASLRRVLAAMVARSSISLRFVLVLELGGEVISKVTTYHIRDEVNSVPPRQPYGTRRNCEETGAFPHRRVDFLVRSRCVQTRDPRPGQRALGRAGAGRPGAPAAHLLGQQPLLRRGPLHDVDRFVLVGYPLCDLSVHGEATLRSPARVPRQVPLPLRCSAAAAAHCFPHRLGQSCCRTFARCARRRSGLSRAGP